MKRCTEAVGNLYENGHGTAAFATKRRTYVRHVCRRAKRVREARAHYRPVSDGRSPSPNLRTSRPAHARCVM